MNTDESGLAAGAVVLIDDTRTFRQPRTHVRARTSAQGLAALGVLRSPGGELWLDHDLGLVDDRPDTILPVLDELARAAADGDPYPVRMVVVHTSNPSGAQTMLTVLRRWGYPVRQVPAGEHLVQDEATDS